MWTLVSYRGVVSALLAALAALALAAGVKANQSGYVGYERIAFAGAAATASVLVALHPRASRKRIGAGVLPGSAALSRQPEGPEGPAGQVETAP